ncbi:MAG: Ldh family oxidoreductase [Bacillota bacterium]|nr:Ldh family oxidoreductase [Bacillota bacterium]
MEKHIISQENEQGLITDILEKVGLGRSQGQIVADVLTKADLRGIGSHGIARLSWYVKKIKLGAVNLNPSLELKRLGPTMALIDGDNGLGHLAALKATEEAIALAKEYGLACVGLRNMNHFGIASYYPMKMADQGLIGLAITNTLPLMAPFGGAERKLGSNPIAVAIPGGKKTDIVIDMSTSNVAYGKLEVALRNGQSIPDTWAITAEGQRTTDPKEGLAGSLLPLGGPKGYGLALLVDIMAGLLTGASYLDRMPGLGQDEKGQELGSLYLALDPSRFMAREDFNRLIEDYIADIKASKKAQGVDQIFLPGERSSAKEEKSKKEGIVISPGLYKEVKELADQVGLDLEKYFSTNFK